MQQSSPRAAAACLAAALLLSPAAGAQRDASRPLPEDIGAAAGHLPKVHYVASDTWRSYPVWVDASLVLDASGGVNTALIPKNEAEWSLRPLLAKPPRNGCVLAGPVLQDSLNAPDRSSLEKAVKSSGLVVLGKVTEKAFGVNVDLPGQLLRVVPEQILKGSGRNVPAYFAFIPVGNFNIGSVHLCVTDGRYADVPQVGDEVLLFVPATADNLNGKQGEPFLQTLDDGGIVTIHADSTVSMPNRFVTMGGGAKSTRDAVVGRVRAAAVQEER